MFNGWQGLEGDWERLGGDREAPDDWEGLGLGIGRPPNDREGLRGDWEAQRRSKLSKIYTLVTKLSTRNYLLSSV